MIDKDALAAMTLDEVRKLHRLAEDEVFNRQCQSAISRGARCTAEGPHEDGWHEYRGTWTSAHPTFTAAPHPAVVRWRFEDDVVAKEHEHEARRRPGAN